MHRPHLLASLTVWAIRCTTGLLAPDNVSAHCDGMDGPVVKAAQRALETGEVHLVLIWVHKQDEGNIQETFQKTLAVRKLSPEARELADRYFFETLVRLHRAGEGAPYTGLKPAGRDLGPAIPAVDKAIEDASPEALLHLLTSTLHMVLSSNANTSWSQRRSAQRTSRQDERISMPMWRSCTSSSGATKP